MNILFLSIGGNPAMDMAFHGFVSLNHHVFEYPVWHHRHGADFNLALTNIPIEVYTLDQLRNNFFDLILIDIVPPDHNLVEDFAILLDNSTPFCVVDQTGVNTSVDWKNKPYNGRIPLCKFVRVIPDDTAIETQETLLMSVRRDWKGPIATDYKQIYLSTFMACTYMSFHDSRFRRLLVEDVFKEYPGCYFNNTFRFGLLKYLELIAQSKSSINIKGMEWDCWRFWEVLNTGSLLIAENSNEAINFDPPFINYEHYVNFKFIFDYTPNVGPHVCKQLCNALDFVSGNAGEAAKIAANGRAFALDCHSSINRAEQIIKHLK